MGIGGGIPSSAGKVIVLGECNMLAGVRVAVGCRKAKVNDMEHGRRGASTHQEVGWFQVAMDVSA